MMGDLLEYFEEKSRNLDNMAPSNSQSIPWNTAFVSCIRFHGVPILPPVLTQRRRTEMLTYKRQAVRRDYKRRIKKREELDSGVKSIIATVEREFSLKSRSTLPRTAGLSKLLEKRASRWSDSSPSSPKSTSSDTSKNKFFGQDQPSSITEGSSESDLSNLSRTDCQLTGDRKATTPPEADTQNQKEAQTGTEKPQQKGNDSNVKKERKQDLRDRTNSLERKRRRKTDPIHVEQCLESPSRSRTDSESNNSAHTKQTLTSLRRSNSMSSLPNPAKILGVNSQILPKPPSSQMSQQQLARRALRQYSNSNPDLRNVDEKDSDIKASDSTEDVRSMVSGGANRSLRQSMSNPDISNMAQLQGDNSYQSAQKQKSSSLLDMENMLPYSNKGKAQTDKLKKKETKKKTDSFSTSKKPESPNKKAENSVQESGKPNMATGQSSNKKYPHNTESDFPSLENCNSLPEDMDGLPLTSVREQQISHTLAKLSRVLNMEETMSTLTSTSSTEVQEKNTILPARIHIPMEEEEDHNLVLSSRQAGQSGHQGQRPSGQNNANILVVHLDSAPKTSESVAFGPDSGPNASEYSFGSNTSQSKLNPASASVRSSASSVTGSQAGRRMSPKGLKNTVHFAPLVTEISTSASQSVEDKILMRKLDITPTNSLQISSVDIDAADGGVVNSKPSSPNTEGSKAMKKIPKHKNEVGLVPPLVDITKANSMLSKVALSPDTDSTGDTPVEQGVPFGIYGCANDPENSTSDKENKFRTKQGRNENKNLLNEMENNSVVSNILNSKNFPPPHHKRGVPSSQHIKSSVISQNSDDGSQTSTLKASQDVLQSVGSSGNDSVYNIRAYSAQGHHQPAKRKLPSVNLSSAREGGKGVRLNEGGQMRERGDVTNISARTTPVGFEHDLYMNPQGHLEQKTKLVAGNQKPFPILTHATAHNHHSNNMQTNRTQSAQQADSRVQQHLNMDVVEDINYAVPQNEMDAEQEAKAEHLRRYLSHVQRQSLEDQSMNEVTKPTQRSQTEDGMFDIGSTIQSFTSTLQSLSNVDEEELLRIQAEHFEKLRKHLVEQQKQQLEELFVHQRREQLTLQQEIELYQKQLKDQQDFLAQNSPQNPTLQHPQHSLQHLTHTQNPGSRKLNFPNNNLGYVPAVPNQPHTPPRQMCDEGPQDANTSRQYTYIPSPSLYFNPRERDNGSDISTFSKATPKQSLKFTNNSAHSTPKASQHKPVQRSPVKEAFKTKPSHRIVVPEKAFDPNMKRCFDRVSACVKGYLTRRLLRTEKVQAIIKTINDTKDFAISFQQETPIRHGNVSHQDRHLLDRIIAQLQGALLDMHEIFFVIPMWERMEIIAHSRQLQEDKRLRDSAGTRSSLSSSHPRISAATLKAIERKKKALEETPTELRPRSAPPNAVSAYAQHQLMEQRPQRHTQGQPSGISTRPKEQSRPKTAPSQSGATQGPGTKAKKISAQTSNNSNQTKTTMTKSAASNKTTATNTSSKSKLGTKPKSSSKAWKG